MTITAQELENIANAALDFYLKGPALSQALQERPLLSMLRQKQKTFSGGKGDIRGNVKGDYTTTFMGYSDDDTVTYKRPANMKQFVVPWKEMHAGIEITFTDLKRDGISVTDSATGESTSKHSDRDMHVISSIFEDKLEDLSEGAAIDFNEILWDDGSRSAKIPAGVTSIIVDDPTSGVREGIDAAANTWWRNRSLTGASKITASASNQTLTKTLRSEARQLKRYGGRPNYVFAGADFIEALELEVHEKGTYTQEGFTKSGSTDIGMADIRMRGIGQVVYDPTLDDLGFSKKAYFIDDRHLKLHTMQGEDMVKHSPARPAEKYVIYRGVTYTGALAARKMNAHGVYEVA